MDSKILANRIMTPDGTMLQSYSVHDYKTYVDTFTGTEFMVDGGLCYLRRNENLTFYPYIEMSVYSTDPHECIREAFCWGTRGKDGKQPLQYKPLMTLDTEHIDAILETQWHIPEYIRKVFNDELDYRSKNV